MNILNTDRYLHVVAFDIPWPANYGGAIDVFYKIKSLHQAGCKIILHAFQYGGRKPTPELEKYCDQVYYYPRKGFLNLFTPTPYIVATRRSDELFTRLLQDDYPILYEGIHTTYYLSHRALKGRRQFVRMHNIEHEYYQALSENEKKFFYKFYLKIESKKLKFYEQILKEASGIIAISPKDAQYYLHFNSNVLTATAFHPFDDVEILTQTSEPFALYHGSLDVSENSAAAAFLVEEVFSQLPYTLIIAGNKPPAFLEKLVKKHSHIFLITGLRQEEFEDLIARAHINILPTFQATGIKLKLLYALYRGKHILVNSPMVEETGLEELCHIADSPQVMREKVHMLFQKPFTDDELLIRKEKLLQKGFDNQTKAKKIIEFLFQ